MFLLKNVLLQKYRKKIKSKKALSNQFHNEK